ncbi:2-isopropylmalate synthase [Anaerofustis stercorihominis]|uniref:2-isopropylmalate synthase n=1 Tax=Anaerofustis stercorihominis TaxID=214853 RepID=UPI001106941B|nr:2-isopropylmalate synthase [Anaerofustis stercorihominis]
MKNFEKYRPYPPMKKTDRKWPDKVIEKAPIWCSVDLRDGNQALEIPMSLDEKIEFYNKLVEIGFKEIEVSFPAASDTEFEFVRTLIEKDMIPDDVNIQVLTQSRDEIIEKTFASIKGAKKAIVHLYNSTSVLQRDVVFNASKEEVTQIAVRGAKKFLEEMKKYPETDFTFEYSPESYTGTEMDYAVEICNAVIDTWHGKVNNKIIINLPSTVEMATANIYADQIEYCSERLHHREDVILSLHAHNDRGTGVAATELALMAGADRVEGTLFGNGERTGNCDIMVVAMNMFSQGIDPKLDFSKIRELGDMYERLTRMEINPRHPYVGSLVFTAFSGSHQDAIRKGMNKREERKQTIWEVPYLPIDPKDVGGTYDPIVRINSQSGKGGVAFVLEQNYGLYLPKEFQKDFSKVTTKVSDKHHSDLAPEVIFDIFKKEYINNENPIKLIKYKETTKDHDEEVSIKAIIEYKGEEREISGVGNGIIDAFTHALENEFNIEMEVTDYREHSMEYGTNARAISYIQIEGHNHKMYYGAGVSSNITLSSFYAVVSVANKIVK